MMRDTASPPVLELDNVRKHFPQPRGLMRKRRSAVKAVDGVAFGISEGETLALVGESGCGKSTLGRCIVRLLDPTAGVIRYHSRAGETIDVARADGATLRQVRHEIRMVFQDPRSSLNPRLTVRDIVGEPLRIRGMRAAALTERVGALLEMVGLRAEYMDRYPHAFSGGERQRIGIARALAPSPRLVIADEAVSALDVSIQAQTLNLLQDLQSELGLTYLFISHDLSVVEHISDRVAVMYVGRLVELAPTELLYSRPRHPYTEALLGAVPGLHPVERRILMSGEMADPARVPPGCPFHPRCRYTQDVCRAEVPAFRAIGAGRQVACHFAEDLDLQGAYDA
jgi:peptide/nickel transport system ATP-binding protein